MTKRERGPREQKILMDALEATEPVMTALLGQPRKEGEGDGPIDFEKVEQLGDLDPNDGIAVAYWILTAELCRIHEASKQPPSFSCGWCQRAAARDGTTWEPALRSEEEHVEHTLHCEHNPLVVEVKALRERLGV